jgi:dienelactone hydrolase
MKSSIIAAMRPRTRVALMIALLVFAAAALTCGVRPYVASAALLLDMSGAMPRVRRVLPVRMAEVDTRDLAIPTRHGDVDARVYRPAAGADRSILVVPGVHAGGVDEPRLDQLARRLAAASAIVVSVPLPELRAYRVTVRSTDVIEDAAVWMSTQRELAPRGRIGVIGVSFSGGLAIVAAGRPSLAGRLTSVVALGGHGDLPRTLRYLCTGVDVDGRARPPHEYALAIFLRTALPKLVPPEQIDALDRALVRYLDAAGATRIDAALATQMWEDARRLGASLEEPARSIMQAIEARDVAGVGALLLPFVEELGGDPALSPERSPLPSVPIFLLHGQGDNVIPSSETPHLAADIRRRSSAPVESLLTPLVSHADMEARAALPDVWRLLLTWTRLWKTFAD